MTACILITTTAFAQKGYYLQFVIQPGSSSISGDWKSTDGSDVLTFKKGFTFSFETGVNAGYNFTDNLGVSVGLLFASQGQNYKDASNTKQYYVGPDILNTETNTYSNDIRFSYLKFPFKFNFISNPEKSLSFSGYAGFYLGFLTGYNQSITYTHTDSYNDGTVNSNISSVVLEGTTYTTTNNSSFSSKQYDLIEKPFNSTNFGLTLGAGIQQKLSDKLSLQLMLNYQLGFGDVKNVASQYRSGSQAINVYKTNDQNRLVSHKNSVLGLMIGITKRL